MDSGQQRGPHIIGLTGSFGSGCSYVANEILAKLDGEYTYARRDTPRPLAYQKLSLSDLLRERFRTKEDKDPKTCPRKELQDFGDKVRLERGADYFAQKAISVIKNASDAGRGGRWILDSIRNPAEVLALREFSPRFFLFGIYADKETRWNRVKEKYDGDRKAFDRDDERDTGDASPGHGQRVGSCFKGVDVVLRNLQHFKAVGNDEFTRFAGHVGQYAALVSEPQSEHRSVRRDESRMAMAYAASQASSCLKRRVGAIIVDDEGSVISSGCNEVPKDERTCQEEYRECYRDKLSKDFAASFCQEFTQLSGNEEEVRAFLRNKFKILDYCRALHAEERAILNLARNGHSGPLEKCTLYTTTYPCRLCANKIVTVGIKHIVYLEPYPDQEAKEILKGAEVKDEFFEGVTSKAYFRIYGEEK